MAIQWFPGHMTSARKKASETMASTDVVVEVVDARIPEASCNPMIGDLRRFRQRPCLKILNKTDLADPVATKAWIEYFNAQPGVTAVALSCKSANDVTRVLSMCQKLAPHRNDGTKRLRLMIMGVPNVGKSTLMNALLKRKVAKVGDEPAVTKSQQTLSLSSQITLTDTPGMMWPKIQHDSDGFMLAACHAIGRNAVIDEEVAKFLAGILLTRYPQLLAERYRLDPIALDDWGVVEEVGRRRGCLIKGGGMDMEKASQILLNDFRSGTLGRISLETPQTRAQMLVEAKIRAEEPPPESASVDDIANQGRAR